MLYWSYSKFIMYSCFFAFLLSSSHTASIDGSNSPSTPRTAGFSGTPQRNNSALSTAPRLPRMTAVASLPKMLLSLQFGHIEVSQSRKTGMKYYYNSVTGESSYHPPAQAIKMCCDENGKPYYLNLITMEETSHKPITIGITETKKLKPITSILSPGKSPNKKKVTFNWSDSENVPERQSKFQPPIPVWAKNPNNVNVEDTQEMLYESTSNLRYTRQDLAHTVSQRNRLGEELHAARSENKVLKGALERSERDKNILGKALEKEKAKNKKLEAKLKKKD